MSEPTKTRRLESGASESKVKAGPGGDFFEQIILGDGIDGADADAVHFFGEEVADDLGLVLLFGLGSDDSEIDVVFLGGGGDENEIPVGILGGRDQGDFGLGLKHAAVRVVERCGGDQDEGEDGDEKAVWEDCRGGASTCDMMGSNRRQACIGLDKRPGIGN